MELRHLRYFTTVAAHGSFNRAAQILHLTQPALSRQVKDLEDEIGVALLVRGKNAITLTEAGEIFYEDSRDLLTRAEQAVQRLKGEHLTQVLRVAYAPSLTVGFMAAAMERFQASVPKVRIELMDLAPRKMAEEAVAGRLDMMIAPQTEIDGYQWTQLRPIELILVMPPGHALAGLKKIAPARLRDVPLIGLGRDNFPDYIPTVRSRLKPFGVTPRFAALVNDGINALFTAVQVHHAAAILGDGAACVMPRGFVARVFSPALGEGMLEAGLPVLRPNPRAEAFVRILREEAARATTCLD